jgi:hypothetical protein
MIKTENGICSENLLNTRTFLFCSYYILLLTSAVVKHPNDDDDDNNNNNNNNNTWTQPLTEMSTRNLPGG